ncbi:ABC transporter substrate-binding protein [Fusobacterium pseudoperiodonticum]|uniref:ABC transporter substrate-binding protein n=1 Tax=Fusobacterium pseudoperiodonticum TaxID=2663009 RepID=UPI000C1B599D|nr:ABC transporter substrate-binding protein [Fusobacterium pseudoperiodonticum]MDU5803424.1 ABC transporter substrate-binding protein [Fusobacterium periodonticum]PIM77714.1 DNA-binding protein [Fusobacterium pseudoperiodonticum]
MKRKLIYLSILVLLILFACSQKENQKERVEKEEKKILTMAQKAEIKTLDPQKATDSVSRSIIKLINQTLVYIDNEGNIVPELAQEITKVSPKETLIKIKNDIKFSNGETLTIDDVLFSLERAKASPKMSQDLYMIESFEKVDDRTLKINTLYDAGNLLHKLASGGVAIVNKKAFEEDENNIVGTGMFKLKEWVAGEKLVLERNEFFKDSKSNIDTLVVKFVPEANSRMIMLETGEIDLARDLLPLDFKKISEDSKFTTVEVETPSNMFLGFDLRNELLADKRVRQAIAYAINNEDLVKTVFNGSASVATSPVPKITTGHNENSNNYPQNIEKAKQLLAEAGYPNGFNIELFVSEDNQRIDMAVIIQDNLKKIGINAEIKTFQWAAYVSTIENPNIIKPLFIMSWNISNDDPDEVLYPLYHSSQIDAHTNVVFYKNEKFDNLISEARETTDKDKRMKLYEEAQDIIQEDLPHYTLVYPKQNFAYKASIKNIKYNKRAYLDFQNTIIE